MKILLSFCAALLFFTACADKDDLDQKNYLTASIQGKAWADKDVLKATSTSNGISFGGSSEEYTLGLFIPKDAGVGASTITSGSGSWRLNANEVKQFTTTSAEMRLVSKTTDRVEGTFKMVLTHPLTGETLSVSDGKFSVAY